MLLNPHNFPSTSHSQLAENTATLSLLECPLRRFSPVNPLVMNDNLRKRPWVGATLPLRRLSFSFPVPCPLIHHSLSPITFLFTLLRTPLHSPKPHPFYFQSIPHSFPQTPPPRPSHHPSSQLRSR